MFVKNTRRTDVEDVALSTGDGITINILGFFILKNTEKKTVSLFFVVLETESEKSETLL